MQTNEDHWISPETLTFLSLSVAYLFRPASSLASPVARASLHRLGSHAPPHSATHAAWSRCFHPCPPAPLRRRSPHAAVRRPHPQALFLVMRRHCAIIRSITRHCLPLCCGAHVAAVCALRRRSQEKKLPTSPFNISNFPCQFAALISTLCVTLFNILVIKC